MRKTAEMQAQEMLARNKKKKLVYVSDESLVDGDIVAGVMFDCCKNYWLVVR